MSVQYHPVDFDALNKGDTIPNDKLEGILGVAVQSKLFKLKALGLRNKIAAKLRERGKPATVAVVREGIKVLTDEEAVEYNPRQYRHGLRRARRSHGRLLDVDPGQLGDASKRTFERAVVVQGAVLAAIASTRQRIVLASYKRQASALPKPE